MTRRTIPSRRPNTLGLGERELAMVLDEFDAIEGIVQDRGNRDFIRWPYRRAAIELRLLGDTGAERSLGVACRNLSSGGVSILHSSFMHAGTRVAVVLPHPERGPEAIAGVVVRCEHRQGMVHEIGIRFAEPIRVLDWVRPDGFAGRYSMERVTPESLSGTIVHVEDGPADQRLVKHFLRETQVRVRPAETVEQGLELVREGCDLVLAEFDLPDRDGAALIESMREAGIQTPVVIVTGDRGGEMRERLSICGPSAVLVKPFRQVDLLRAVAEFLTVGREAGSPHSTLGRDDPAAPLVDGYVNDLRAAAAALREAMRSGDSASCRRQCVRLAGHAPMLGYGQIAALARDAAGQLGSSAGVEGASRTLRALVTACERARGWPEAA